MLLLIALSLLALEAVAFSKEICLDTDASKENPEYSRGYVTTIDGISWDDCDDDVLIERYCSNGKLESKRVQCEKGCTRGICSKYQLFKPARLKMPLLAKFASYFGFEEPKDKKVSKYEIEKINTNLINSAFRDIDKRLSIIEANIPEENLFPIVLENSEKQKFKAAANNGMVQLTETKFLLPDLSTTAMLSLGDMGEKEFYRLIEGAESNPITKKGKAFMLFASQ